MMYKDLFSVFIASNDTLRIYRDDALVFSSEKDRLLPLMEYITLPQKGKKGRPVTIFDKVMGNAAALLAIKANCREVYSPLGSELAIKTLERAGIEYHLDEIVPYIMSPDGKGMCPMERLSVGKEPDDFYREMQSRIKAGK
jgi:hypothetical protein